MPLSWRRKLLVGQDVLKAIANLHEAELIHRDIKTDNVLVRRVSLGWGGAFSACVAVRNLVGGLHTTQRQEQGME